MAGKKTNNKKGVTVVVRPTRKRSKTKKQDQVTALGRALRELGGLGGNMLGSAVGAGALGGGFGRAAGAQVSRWLGQGDYSISKNSILKPDSVPMMHKNSQSVVIRHREYICEVRSSTTFAVQRVLPINPGLEETFPWLSGVASQFQEYNIRGLVYHYVPTSGAVTTSQALGSVMLQTTYRATDTAPTSKVEMMNEYWAEESVPSEAVIHGLECDPKENPFQVHYVRTANVGTGDNLLMYDLGKTYLAVQGQSATGVILGDLWATYEIELHKPIITDSLGLGTRSAQLRYTTATTSWSTIKSTFSSDFTFLGTTLGSGITLPRVLGSYMVTVVAVGSTAASNWTPSVTGPATTTAAIFNGSWYSASNITSGSNPILDFVFTVPNTTTPSVINVYSGGSSITGGTVVDVYITEINPAIL